MPMDGRERAGQRQERVGGRAGEEALAPRRCGRPGRAQVAGSRARSAEAGQGERVARHAAAAGPGSPAPRASQRRAAQPTWRSQALPSTPEARRPCRPRRGAGPPPGRRRAGATSAISGCSELEAVAIEAGVAKNGETAASGWIAEHTSWREPGQRQLGRAGAAADRVDRLEHEHRSPGLGAGEGGGEPVRACSHDHDVRQGHSSRRVAVHGSDDRRDPGGRSAGGVDERPASRWTTTARAASAPCGCGWSAATAASASSAGRCGTRRPARLADGTLDGLPTTASDAPPADPADHPNGATYIDHVVLLSPDLARTIEALERDRVHAS